MRIQGVFRRPFLFGICGVLCALLASPRALSAISGHESIDVLQLTFVRTVSTPANGWTEEETERGTFRISQDGRYRVDTFYADSGETLAEIYDVPRERKLKLNLTQKWGVESSTKALVLEPTPPGRPVVPTTPQGPPQGRMGVRGTEIGARTVGGITLFGTRAVFHVVANGEPVAHVMEFWSYQFTNRAIRPILIESSFAAPDEKSATRVVDVAHVQAPATIFNAPKGFAITSVK